MAEKSIDGAFESMHPGETSLVPRLDGEVKSTKGKNLPDSAKPALSVLRYALDEAGAVPPAGNHIPNEHKCVTLKQWREYAAMRSGLDKPDSKPKAFDQGCKRLSLEKTCPVFIRRYPRGRRAAVETATAQDAALAKTCSP